jgi:leucyl aminopeptidase
MKVIAVQDDVTTIRSDATVAGLFSDNQFGPVLEALDSAVNGALQQLVESGEMSGKLGEMTSILTPNGLPTKQLVVVGLGDRDGFGPSSAARAAGTAAKQLANRPRQSILFCLDGDWDDEMVEIAISSIIAGCQGQDLHRSERKLHPFEEVVWRGASPSVVDRGVILGDSINLTRRLVNEYPSYLTPARFAREATQVAAGCGLQIEVWNRKELKKQKCGALLAVARGSASPPRMVILKYQGAASDAAHLALVGKGVTFDSGGLSLKPSDSMKTMKCDMAGAATVLGAMTAIAKLQLPVNVVGYAGLVENMVGGKSYKLGDVLTSRSGKTIEVHNTDAEGRLVLADVLDVAVEAGAGRLIDLATLTGACLVALGTDVAGLMSNDQSWCDAVSRAAQRCGELAWQLPMFSDYDPLIESGVADIKNVGEGRWAGAITAAKFLEQFVGETPWVHIDIAGPAFSDKPKAWLDAGGTGSFVRTLVEVVRHAGREIV